MLFFFTIVFASSTLSYHAEVPITIFFPSAETSFRLFIAASGVVKSIATSAFPSDALVIFLFFAAGSITLTTSIPLSFAILSISFPIFPYPMRDIFIIGPRIKLSILFPDISLRHSLVFLRSQEAYYTMVIYNALQAFLPISSLFLLGQDLFL